MSIMNGVLSFLILGFLFFSTIFGHQEPISVLRGYVLPSYNFIVDIIERPSTVYEGGKSLILTLENEKLTIEMMPNTRLYAPYYTYFHPSRNALPSTSQNCHYQGRVEGYAGSFVALSNCEGYHGMIILNETSTKYSVHALDIKNKVVLKLEQSKDFHDSNVFYPLPRMPFDKIPKIVPMTSLLPTTATSTTTTLTSTVTATVTATVTSTLVKPVQTETPNVPNPPKPKHPIIIKTNTMNKGSIHSKDPLKRHFHSEKETQFPEKKKNTFKRHPFKRSYKITGTFRLKGKDLHGSSTKFTPTGFSNEENENEFVQRHSQDRLFKRSFTSIHNFNDTERWMEENNVQLKKRGIHVQHPQRASNFYDLFFGLDPLPGLKENYVEHLIGDYINLLQLHYDRSKLQYNVRLSGAIYFPREKMINPFKNTLHLIDSWAYFTGKYFSTNRDIAFLLTNEPVGNKEGVGGRGYGNTEECNLYAAASFAFYIPNEKHNLYGVCEAIAHEIGHNLGMTHPEKGKCSKDGGVMNAAPWYHQPWLDYSQCHLSQLRCKPGDFAPSPLKLTVGSL